MVTRDGFIDHCYFQHPREPSTYRTADGWLSAGWHDNNFEPVTGVTAWRPPLLPFGEERPEKRLQAGPGDRVTSARLVLKGETIIHLEIEGGDRMADSLQYNDVRSAVDSLFDALLPRDIGNTEMHLYRGE
jgi:hypothetical protein